MQTTSIKLFVLPKAHYLSVGVCRMPSQKLSGGSTFLVFCWELKPFLLVFFFF